MRNKTWKFAKSEILPTLMLRIQRGLPEENPFTGVSYFELYIGRYVSQPMMWLHIPVSRSTRPGHRWELPNSAFETTSFLQVRRCPVPMGRGLSDIALGSRLTSFLIGAESIKNSTLNLLSGHRNCTTKNHRLFARRRGIEPLDSLAFIPTLNRVLLERGASRDLANALVASKLRLGLLWHQRSRV
jgi:hypothetical protein